MTVTMTVRRKDQLYRKLAQIAPMTEEEIAKANRKTGDELVTIARSFAPVRTGRLRASIVASFPGQATPAHSQGGARPVPEGSVLVTAGNNQVRYAHLVEYGTSPHVQGGRFAGTVHPGTPRRPFFWPAYRLVKKRHRGRISRAIKKAIQAVT